MRGSIQGVVLARDTGRERIDSGSDIDTPHGAKVISMKSVLVSCKTKHVCYKIKSVCG